MQKAAASLPRKRPQSKPATTPKTPVVRSEPALVCEARAIDFESVASTSMFDRLGGIRALPAAEASRAIVIRGIAEARGYSDEQLYAIAEIGYHYFRNGGLRLAEVIFDGLAAIKGDEPYFHLALGLVRDYLDDKRGARRSYEAAARLDPRDARADINLAELCLEEGDRRSALALLERARQKADGRDETLAKKACALIRLARGTAKEISR